MENLISHGDGDYSSYRILDASPRPGLVLSTLDEHDQSCVSVFLDRDAVQRLHNALGEWLHPQDLGPTNGQLAVAVKALADAVNGAATSVRPLWGRSEYVDAKPEPTINPCGCHDSEGYSVVDVPEPMCAECGHPRGNHFGLQACDTQESGIPCLCIAYTDVFAQAVPPSCVECGHPYSWHATDALGRTRTDCVRYRSAP